MADSARTSVRTDEPHPVDQFAVQVMSFVGRPTARRSYRKTRAAVASVARERIEILIDQAQKMARKDEVLSKRYVDLARRISERTKVRIPRELKRYLCKGCGLALVPGDNARVRLHAHGTEIVITCLSCGAMKRYPVTNKFSPRKTDATMKPYIVQAVPFPKKNSSKE